MSKKIKITESQLKNSVLLMEDDATSSKDKDVFTVSYKIPKRNFDRKMRRIYASIISEEIDKEDVIELFKKNRDFEKRVKEISAGVISELFRILWQRKGFYDEIKR
jgi:hypothetical protein